MVTSGLDWTTHKLLTNRVVVASAQRRPGEWLAQDIEEQPLTGNKIRGRPVE